MFSIAVAVAIAIAPVFVSVPFEATFFSCVPSLRISSASTDRIPSGQNKTLPYQTSLVVCSTLRKPSAKTGHFLQAQIRLDQVRL